MREGKNREVKNVLGHLGLAVNRLIRVSFGPFRLGDLPEGAVEEVKTRILRDQLGDRIAALAGADFSAPIVSALIPPPERGRSTREAGRVGVTPSDKHRIRGEAGPPPGASKARSRASSTRYGRHPSPFRGREPIAAQS
jgi:23S rRNA pseudouridine2605 synthase